MLPNKPESHATESATPTSRMTKLLLLLMSLWLIVLTFCLVNAKENVFMDEALTYFRCCNYSDDVFDEFYQTQDDPADFFRHFYSVEEPFRYDAIYQNETENVHPPLYYYLLHTICSLFSGRFSLHFAGAINAIFAVGILLALNGILGLMDVDEKARVLLCLPFVLSPGVWDILSYLRMYVMLGFWITTLTWLFLANEKGSVRHYRLWLFATVYCGIMTHHHFLIYLAGSSFTYLAILLMRKDKETILRHVWIVLAGSLCAVASFPPMIAQILHSNRGSEAQRNFLNWHAYLPRMRFFAENSGGDLFGSLAPLAAIVFLVCLLTVACNRYWKKAQVKADAPSLQDLCMLLVPAGFYFVVVCITASFLSQRYLFSIYPLCLTVFFLLIYKAIMLQPATHRAALPLVALVMALATVFAFRSATFPYLYQGDAEKREALLPYAETDCLYLVQFSREDHKYVDFFTDYMELSMYGSLTVVDALDPATPATAFSDRDCLIIVTDDGYFYHSDDLQGEVEAFCVRNGLPSHVTDLGKFSQDTHTYLCTREGEGTQ